MKIYLMVGFLFPLIAIAGGNRRVVMYDHLLNLCNNHSNLSLSDYLPDNVGESIYFDQKYCFSRRGMLHIDGKDSITLMPEEGPMLSDKKELIFKYKEFINIYSSRLKYFVNYFKLDDINKNECYVKFVNGIREEDTNIYMLNSYWFLGSGSIICYSRLNN